MYKIYRTVRGHRIPVLHADKYESLEDAARAVIRGFFKGHTYQERTSALKMLFDWKAVVSDAGLLVIKEEHNPK